MPESLANGASSTLNGAITNSATSLTIQTADISKFPASGTFRIAVTDNTNTELMTVTAGQGTATFTVTRHSEAYAGSSTSYAFASGSTVAQVLTYAGLTALVPIKYAETVLGASAASVTFSSIPQGYRNIRVTWQARGDAAGNFTSVNLQINGDTGSNYDQQWIQYSNALAASSAGINQTATQVGQAPSVAATSNLFGSAIFTIPNYPGTTNYKTIECQYGWEWGVATNQMTAGVTHGTWRNTNAITSLVLAPGSGNFVAGSTFTLYLEP